jgi:hypothetical protein
MHTPVWVSPAHPIASRELGQWRKQRRVLWITFVILPLLVSACMWSAFLSPRRTIWLNDLLSAINFNIWALQLFLGIWLSVVVTARSATLIARERETYNWPLLKIIPRSEVEILSLKGRAIFYALRWPIVLVVCLRGLSILSSLASPQVYGLSEVALAAVFAVVFCAEFLVSLNYNYVVGATASTLANTTASATAVAYLIHGLATVFIFGPLWWGFFFSPLGRMMWYYGPGNNGALWAFVVLYSVLCVVQLLLIGLGNSLAARGAEREAV